VTIADKLQALARMNDLDAIRLGLLIVLDEVDRTLDRRNPGRGMDMLLGKDTPINREAA
jgi:hypothetical protein